MSHPLCVICLQVERSIQMAELFVKNFYSKISTFSEDSHIIWLQTYSSSSNWTRRLFHLHWIRKCAPSSPTQLQESRLKRRDWLRNLSEKIEKKIIVIFSSLRWMIWLIEQHWKILNNRWGEGGGYKSLLNFFVIHLEINRQIKSLSSLSFLFLFLSLLISLFFSSARSFFLPFHTIVIDFALAWMSLELVLDVLHEPSFEMITTVGNYYGTMTNATSFSSSPLQLVSNLARFELS